MKVDTNHMLSITDANKNFSKVTRMVDETGVAVILKNNVPRCVVLEFGQIEQAQVKPDEDIMDISSRLVSKNMDAYLKLAK